jgi:hypothetical protein
VSSDHVGIPTDVKATIDTATEERFLFCAFGAEMSEAG